MTKRLYQLTTTFLGADKPTMLYFNMRQAAADYFRHNCSNGIITAVNATLPDNYYNVFDGCTFNDMSYGGYYDIDITPAN